MRHKKETATSFNQLRETTQAIQAAQKNSSKTSDNANTNEIKNQSILKPTAHAKKSALKPTKRAFSERQTTIKDNSQASVKEIKRGGN